MNNLSKTLKISIISKLVVAIFVVLSVVSCKTGFNASQSAAECDYCPCCSVGVFDLTEEQKKALGKIAFKSVDHYNQYLDENDYLLTDNDGIQAIEAQLSNVVDVKTGSENNLLTPNGNLRICGYKIKIAGENSANGLYFVNQTTQLRTKVDAIDVISNNSFRSRIDEIIILTPALAAGTYKLEVITQFNGRKMLDTPRTIVNNEILTVP